MRPPLTARFTVEPDAWLRRPQVTTWFARYFRILGVLDLVVAFLFVVAAAQKNEPALGVVTSAFLVLGAAVCEGLARRYAGRGLLLSSDAVVVRNLLTTHRVSLDDAEHFSPGVPFGMHGPCPMLRCRTGVAVGVGGLGVAAATWRYEVTMRELEPVCALLNEVLDRLKTGA